jgi:diguanylate cyclase (GGDEF)-like protein
MGHRRHDDIDRTTRAAVPLAPRSRRGACVIVLGGRAAVGQVFKLTRTVVLGRAADADIPIDDDGLSRRHCELRVLQGGDIQVVDLGSTNGTFRNGERVKECVLVDGDRLQLGPATLLQLSYQDELDEAWQRNVYDSATRDALTQAYNRKYFVDAFEREFAYARRHDAPLSLVLLEVDHLKQVNEGCGHQAGDFILRRLAQTVTGTIRLEDTFARYSHEEFALLLRDTAADGAGALVERIRRIVEATPFVFEGRPIPVTISAGVATLAAASHATPEELVGAAARYLYRAKQRGRNRVESAATAEE